MKRASIKNAQHCAFSVGELVEEYVRTHFANKTGLLIREEDVLADVLQKLKRDLEPYGFDPTGGWKDVDAYIFVEMPKTAALRLNHRYSEENDYFISAPVINGEIHNRRFRRFYGLPLYNKEG